MKTRVSLRYFVSDCSSHFYCTVTNEIYTTKKLHLTPTNWGYLKGYINPLPTIMYTAN